MPKAFGTPGPRAIYPDLCDSPSLARCGLLANALWPRLIVQADDQGRLVGDPLAVMVSCFPKMLDRVTFDDVAAAIDELVRAKMVIRYRRGGAILLQLAGWWQWQSSMRRAYPSRFPQPVGWRDVVYGLPSGGPQNRDEALQAGGIVLKSGRPRAGKSGVSAGRSAAPRPQVADKTGVSAGSAGARAARPGPARPSPALTEPGPADSNRAPAAAKTPHAADRSQATNGRDRSADVEAALALAQRQDAGDAARRAARKTVERYAPERLAELEEPAARPRQARPGSESAGA